MLVSVRPSVSLNRSISVVKAAQVRYTSKSSPAAATDNTTRVYTAMTSNAIHDQEGEKSTADFGLGNEKHGICR